MLLLKVPSTFLLHFKEHCAFHGRIEVKWGQGQEKSLAPLCSIVRSFGSKFTVMKKALATLLRLSARGHCVPLAPSLRLWCIHTLKELRQDTS